MLMERSGKLSLPQHYIVQLLFLPCLNIMYNIKIQAYASMESIDSLEE